MATVHQFEELEIWQLAFTIYKKVSPIAEKMRQSMIIVLQTKSNLQLAQ